MTRLAKISLVALCLGFGLAGAASAQSTGAPAGRLPAAAPGGAVGKAGARNRADAMRSGKAYGYRRMRRHPRMHR